MFWDASYTPSPKIEALLNKENVTLLELLDDEEIISECKSQNSKLVQFLNRPDILEELITLITTVPPVDSNDVTLRFKHSNIACEILTSDLQSINRSIVCEEKVLLRLYAFLEQDAPLNPLLLSFFSKVFGMLWTQKQKQDWFTYQFVCVTLLEFLKSRENFLDTVLRHVYSPVMLDLVYHMVTHIEGPDIRKTLYEWLMDQGMVEKLIGILGETGEEAADKHLNVAQFVVEYLSMGRTKRQSEKQEGVTADPILDLLEDKTTIQLLLDKMVCAQGTTEATASSAIVAGTRIILALFDDNLINDNTDDPALQYLVNSEKEHHDKVVANLIEVIKGYVDKFHDLLLIEPTPIVSTVIDTQIETITNETIVVSTNESTPEKNTDKGDDSKDSGKASDSEKVDEDQEVTTDEEQQKDQEVTEKEDRDSSEESSSSSSVGEAQSPEERASPEKVKQAEKVFVSTRRNNNFARGPAFGNTRLQICCLFTVLLETENRDIINAICASNFFKTLLNLFKQYCWNNFLHSQVKKCLTYAIGAYDEVRDETSASVQLEISEMQRHLIVDCRLAPVLVECWYANEVEEVERNGVRLGYMGHLIGILDVLTTNCKVSEKLRALVEETLCQEATEAAFNPDQGMWSALTGEKGNLETELENQNRFLADCNPARMSDCEPKDFFIEATDSFQDLESTALSENLDNFLSRYISSDLNSHFFNTVNGWSEDNLDEFEGLADKNWSKFDGEDDDEEAEASTSDPMNFVRPWDTPEDEEQEVDDPAGLGLAHKIPEALVSGGGVVVGGVGAEGVSQPDSGWANFSSANFADFDTHFNEFAIGTFDGAETEQGPQQKTQQMNNTFELANESVEEGGDGDVKSDGDVVQVKESDADTKKPEVLASANEVPEKVHPSGEQTQSPVPLAAAAVAPLTTEISTADSSVTSLTGQMANCSLEEGSNSTGVAQVDSSTSSVVDSAGKDEEDKKSVSS